LFDRLFQVFISLALKSAFEAERPIFCQFGIESILFAFTEKILQQIAPVTGCTRNLLRSEKEIMLSITI